MGSPKIEPSMNDFSPNIQVTPVEPVDYGKHFTTSRIFYSRDELVTWARNIGKSIGSVIVIARSDNGRSSKKQFVMLACERSGKYKPYKKTGLHSTNTRKCMCPFRLKGSLVKSDGGWIAKVMCGFHNHYLQASLEGHPFIGRLTSEEKTVVENLTMNMVGPKQVMTALKNNNKDNSTTIMQVYNARKRYRTNLRKGRTELQYLMNLMLRDEYIHWHRKDDGDVVTDICWVHPDSVKLLNSFHIVLLIDATYKTNKYRMPLVEIVGVTSTNKTFVVAFAFIKSENVESYSWVLQKVKSLFYIDNVVPHVIVTDRELALMKAISDVFPSTTHLLCQFHIKKCVKAKAKLEMKGEAEKVELVMQEFDNLMYCPAVEEYEEQLKLFEKNCAPFDDFVAYVHKEWLTPYKEKFVQAWIDRVMHLGNTTTNRVESSHWQLKRLLRDSMGNLCSCWDTMNNSIRLQLTEIQASFEHSISRLKHCYNSPLYKILNSVVSTAALDLIAGELKRAGGVGIDCSQCGCVIRKTHGLPCSCELARYTMGYTPIPLDAIHIHWRILHLNNNCYTDQNEGSELSLDVEFDAIRRRFEQSDVIAKRVLKAQVRELAFPDTTSLCPPNVKVSTKGAPKKRKALNMEKSTKRNPSWWEHVDILMPSQKSTKRNPSSIPPLASMAHVNHFPPQLHRFIDKVIDVKPDGNCGFRCVAASLGMGEDGWAIVRNDLYKEVNANRLTYEEVLGGFDYVERLKSLLMTTNTHGSVPRDKWMEMPDTGYVIANRYKVVVITISMNGSSTIFPLLHAPHKDFLTHRIVCIGHIASIEHFVQICLTKDAPIPPPDIQWSRCKSKDASAWEDLYVNRVQHWKSIFFNNNLNPPPIVDLTADV